MHFSISCGLSFMCVTVLLFLPAQGELECAETSPSVIASRASISHHFTCCSDLSTAHIKEPVSACYEQKDTFSTCKTHAYIFKNASNYCYCVDPNASWIPKRLEKLKTRGINCEVLR